MTSLREVLVGQPTMIAQFAKPTGFLGWIVGLIMRFRPSNRERIRRTIDSLGISPADRVLEIGFGPGLGIARAAALAHQGFVFGVDHSEMMLRQAMSANRKAVHEGRVRLVCSSIEAMPDEARDFDKVFAINVFMFWSDPVAELKKVHARMKPGATIALALQPRKKGANNEDARTAAATMSKALADAGFGATKSELFAMSPVDTACAHARA